MKEGDKVKVIQCADERFMGAIGIIQFQADSGTFVVDFHDRPAIFSEDQLEAIE